MGNGRYAFYGALAVVSLNGPPTALIDQAMPMTVLFTLGMAVVITLRYGRSLRHFLAVLLTCAVLVALLGLGSVSYASENFRSH